MVEEQLIRIPPMHSNEDKGRGATNYNEYLLYIPTRTGVEEQLIRIPPNAPINPNEDKGRGAIN